MSGRDPRRFGRLEAVVLRTYAALLGLLPKELREAHGTEMVQTLRDLLAAERVRGGTRAVWRASVRTLVQTLRAAVAERIGAGRRPDTALRRSKAQSAGWGDRMEWSLRQATRSIRAQPGFAATVVLVLAIGIGATTTIFSAVQGILLRPLPYPEIDRLVYLEQASHSPDEYLAWRELPAFEEMAALQTGSRDVVGGDVPEAARVTEVNESYFELLGVAARLGRLLTDDDGLRADRVAVVSHTYWTERLGGAGDVIGATIRLNDEPFTIVGVAERFETPLRVNRGLTDVWIPLTVAAGSRANLRIFARLRTGVGRDEARIQVQRSVDELAALHPEDYAIYSSGRRVPVVPMKSAEVLDLRLGLYLLFGSVAMLLLIACATVANLFLARTRDRRHELAVRAALGGSRRTVAQHLLTESLLLSVASGVLGAAFAATAVSGIVAVLPPELPRVQNVSMDGVTLLFAGTAAVLSGIVFGLAPIGFTPRLEHGAARAPHSSGTGGRWVRLRGMMVSTQVALALVLLIGSGLLFNSFVRLLRVDPGFEPADVIAAELSIGRRHASSEARVRFVRDVGAELQRSAGVEAVAHGLQAPFSRESGCCWWGPATTQAGTDSVRVQLNPASAGFMEVLGVPLLRGIDLPAWEPADGTTVPLVVGTSVERQLFAGASALGRTLRLGNGGPEEATVVGVIDDLRFGDLSTPTAPQVYMPYSAVAALHGSVTFVVRRAGPGLTGDAIRSAIWRVDPLIPVPRIVALADQVSLSVAPYRFVSTLLLGFAGFALTLAVVGTYGTVRYAVARRRRELGVRLVLGASPGGLVRFAMGRGVVWVGGGIVAGVAAAAALSALLRSVVFGITPWDPPTYLVLVTLIGGAALLACYVPARHAARVDPMETMRAE